MRRSLDSPALRIPTCGPPWSIASFSISSVRAIARAVKTTEKTCLPEPMKDSAAFEAYSWRNSSSLPCALSLIVRRRQLSCSGVHAVAFDQVRLVLAPRARADPGDELLAGLVVGERQREVLDVLPADEDRREARLARLGGSHIGLKRSSKPFGVDSTMMTVPGTSETAFSRPSAFSGSGQ
jgi:hypothetical protein